MTGPTVRLRSMSGAEYDEFIRHSHRGYAEQIAAAGDVTPEDARAKAAHDLASVLPRGRGTDGHLFFVALDDGGERVGHLWLALRAPGGASAGGWVYDVEVRPQLRGRGLGRAIMEQAERELAARGVGRVGLNVFGFNTTAIELYRSLGYHVTAMQMSKPLAGPPAGASRETE
jgi:GNAT superfamily N-acetyltransferase